MNFAEFTSSIEKQTPPDGLAPTVHALWWAAKGEWDKAHKIVQDDESREAAWVHAYLHRVEGDLPNARYWYSTAGKPVETRTLENEWKAIPERLLAS
jgi:hypothetical protein